MMPIEKESASCPWLPHADAPGVCDRCGTELTGRQTRWCSSSCMNEWRAQHDWGMARNAAKKRDHHQCVKCGAEGQYDWREPEKAVRLEVNHIVPRVGRGYGFGCHNHHDNLETLCHPCHVEVTKQQAANRRAQHTGSGPALFDVVGDPS